MSSVTSERLQNYHPHAMILHTGEGPLNLYHLKDTFYYVRCAGSAPKYELKTREREGPRRALHSTQPPIQWVTGTTGSRLKRPDGDVHS